MSDSYVETIGEGGIAFVGPDATELYRAMMLRHGLRLLAGGIKLSHGVTLTRALAQVKRYTGQTYKRTEAARAIADLAVWIATMQSAMPIKRARP